VRLWRTRNLPRVNNLPLRKIRVAVVGTVRWLVYVNISLKVKKRSEPIE
jgi:hypothetical protein